MASADPEHRRQVEDVCHAALERDATERPAFLAAACAGDDAMRREVEMLLAHAPGIDSFLGASVGGHPSRRAEMILVQNWFQELKQRVPVK